jgi:hypothetical protein
VSSSTLHQATDTPPSIGESTRTAPLIQLTNTPTPEGIPSQLVPQSHLFFSLPTYEVGQVIEIEGFKIQLTSVVLEKAQLRIAIALENSSLQAIDLGWAIQLRDENGGFVKPTNSLAAERKQLQSNETLSRTWQYELETLDDDSNSLRDYRLIYAPRGWSGPVMIFRLAPQTVIEK